MAELTLERLKESAQQFVQEFGQVPIPELFGVTDGKAVGTFVEQQFHAYLKKRHEYTPGSAASGNDFPELGVDLKVTSIKQPQSSCPFVDASQKVYGLGYHLLVLVYEKTDDNKSKAACFKFHHAIFVSKERTCDYQTTSGLLEILRRKGNADDIDAFLEERRLPVDDVGRRQLAERILREPPQLGYLTVSNALQWRLQYTRAIEVAASKQASGVENLLA